MARSARLFVFSGPAGVGKGTILKSVLEERPCLHLTVSATTRKPRPGEVPGVSYHYISDERFTELVEEGAFLEWANVHGNRYGTLWSEVHDYIGRDISVVLEIDVQGALNVKRLMPEAVLLFVDPPSMEELERRLRDRGTEDEEHILLRLSNARHEIELSECYDAHIVNDDLSEAVRRTIALIDRFESDGGSDHHGSDQA